jgi:hypothetical protein
VNDLHVREPASRDGALQVAGVPHRALDERDVRLGQRRRQGQAGPAGARADVRDPPRFPHSVELERHERVRDVAVDGRRDLAHGRRRGGVGRLQVQDRSQRFDACRRQGEVLESRHARR